MPRMSNNLFPALGGAVAGALVTAGLFMALRANIPAASTTSPTATSSAPSAPLAPGPSSGGELRQARDAADALRRERDAARAEVARLKAGVQVPIPEAAAAADVALRPTAVVAADLKALIKSEGMDILKLEKDHPLMRELAAMGPEGIKLLGDLLANGTQDERFAAAALMEKLADPAAVPLLEAALFGGDNDENMLVQRMASHALGRIGGETGVPVLERVVEGDFEWGVRTNAAFSLAEMGRQSGIDWLRESYTSQQDAMAKTALLGAMGQIGDPSYLPILHDVLKTETEYTKRYLAVVGITKAARRDSLPILKAIIDDPTEDKMIITEAQKAYDEIMGDD